MDATTFTDVLGMGANLLVIGVVLLLVVKWIRRM